MDAPRLVSVQVGQAQTFDDSGGDRKWQSAIVKESVSGPVEVTQEGLVGDHQVDRINHGGADKAVLSYSADHFAFWSAEFSDAEGFPDGGAFGENLTVSGLTEQDVCVGDVWQIGDCKLQISQPRQPCWKLSKRWGLDGLANRVQKTGFSGWYFRVLETGAVKSAAEIETVLRPHPEWTISSANEVMYVLRSAAKDRELAACPALSDAWRTQLLTRAEKREKNADRDG